MKNDIKYQILHLRKAYDVHIELSQILNVVWWESIELFFCYSSNKNCFRFSRVKEFKKKKSKIFHHINPFFYSNLLQSSSQWNIYYFRFYIFQPTKLHFIWIDSIEKMNEFTCRALQQKYFMFLNLSIFHLFTQQKINKCFLLIIFVCLFVSLKFYTFFLFVFLFCYD